MKYIAYCSGGKDSVATLLLAKEYGEPLDEVVCCEVMFDKDTSGEMPEHRDFLYQILKPYVENVLNVPFTIIHSDRTYVDVFTHTVTRGESKGKIHGFPLPGMCAINRDCKLRAIIRHQKENSVDVQQYVGIAFDEPKRLKRLEGTNRVSLLGKYRVTESEAAVMCYRAGLYSPTYKFSDRNGCWFCMNCKDNEWAHLIFSHSQLFDKLIDLEKSYPERYRRSLTINETPSELKRRIMINGEQLTIL